MQQDVLIIDIELLGTDIQECKLVVFAGIASRTIKSKYRMKMEIRSVNIYPGIYASTLNESLR